MTIPHKNIPNSDLHEPKDIISALANTVYVANGFATGVWTRPYEKIVDRADKTKNVFGWNDIADSLYTSGAPLSISSGVRTKLTNNGLGVQSDTSRLGAIWNTTTNVFTIDDLNAMYEIRITMKVKAAAAAGTTYVVKVELESASGPLVFVARDNYLKGGSYENAIEMTSTFYSGSAINNTALSIYLTPDTNITVYGIGYLIKRTYAEKNY